MAHFVAAVVVGTLAVIRAVVVLAVGVITVIHIVAAVVVVQMVAHGSNFSFPCRPGGVSDRWGTTTGHLRRLARLRAHTLSLH